MARTEHITKAQIIWTVVSKHYATESAKDQQAYFEILSYMYDMGYDQIRAFINPLHKPLTKDMKDIVYYVIRRLDLPMEYMVKLNE